jgi:hypothetical protein
MGPTQEPQRPPVGLGKHEKDGQLPEAKRRPGPSKERET